MTQDLKRVAIDFICTESGVSGNPFKNSTNGSGWVSDSTDRSPESANGSSGKCLEADSSALASLASDNLAYLQPKPAYESPTIPKTTTLWAKIVGCGVIVGHRFEITPLLGFSYMPIEDIAGFGTFTLVPSGIFPFRWTPLASQSGQWIKLLLESNDDGSGMRCGCKIFNPTPVGKYSLLGDIVYRGSYTGVNGSSGLAQQGLMKIPYVGTTSFKLDTVVHVGSYNPTHVGHAYLNKSLLVTMTSGSFSVGEIVTGSSSAATGVIDYVSTLVSASSKGLSLHTVSGTFQVGEVVTGSTSSATATVVSVFSGGLVVGLDNLDWIEKTFVLESSGLGTMNYSIVPSDLPHQHTANALEISNTSPAVFSIFNASSVLGVSTTKISSVYWKIKNFTHLDSKLLIMQMITSYVTPGAIGSSIVGYSLGLEAVYVEKINVTGVSGAGFEVGETVQESVSSATGVLEVATNNGGGNWSLVIANISGTSPAFNISNSLTQTTGSNAGTSGTIASVTKAFNVRYSLDRVRDTLATVNILSGSAPAPLDVGGESLMDDWLYLEMSVDRTGSNPVISGHVRRVRPGGSPDTLVLPLFSSYTDSSPGPSDPIRDSTNNFLVSSVTSSITGTSLSPVILKEFVNVER